MTQTTYFLVLTIAIPLLLAPFLLWKKSQKINPAYISSTAFLGSLISLGFLAYSVSHPLIRTTWIVLPTLTIPLGFQITPLALLCSLIPILAGLITSLYSYFYFDSSSGRLFNFFSLLLCPALLCLFFANSLAFQFLALSAIAILQFLFASISRKKGTLKPLQLVPFLVLITASCGFLVGTLLIFMKTGTLNLTWISTMSSQPHLLIQWGTGLILFSSLSFTAIFPFQSWLLLNHDIKAPFQGILQSSIVTSISLFIFFQFYPILSLSQHFKTSLIIFGLLSLCIGAIFSLLSHSLTQLLTFNTIWEIGALCLFVTLVGNISLNTLGYIVITHFIFKLGLFLVGGIWEKQSHFKSTPLLLGSGLVCLLTMAHIPGTMGYVVHYKTITLLIDNSKTSPYGWLILIIYGLTSAVLCATAFRLIKTKCLTTSLTPSQNTPLLPQIILVLLCLPLLIFGIWPTLLFKGFDTFKFLPPIEPSKWTLWTPNSTWSLDPLPLFISSSLLLIAGLLIYKFDKKDWPYKISKSFQSTTLWQTALTQLNKLSSLCRNKLYLETPSSYIKLAISAIGLCLIFSLRKNLAFPSFLLDSPWALPHLLSLFFGLLMIFFLGCLVLTSNRELRIISFCIIGFILSLYLAINQFTDIALILLLMDCIALFLLLRVTASLHRSHNQHTGPFLIFSRNTIGPILIAVGTALLFSIILLSALSLRNPEPIGLIIKDSPSFTTSVLSLFLKFRAIELWASLILLTISITGAVTILKKYNVT